MYADQETGLYYNMARYYDPRIGRYISSDPIGLQGGLNTYSYVRNNPLNSIDPLGLMEWTGKVSGGSILVAGAYVYKLKSKCVGGKRAVVTIFAFGGGPSVDANFSATAGRVSFTDSLGNEINPDVFRGEFKSADVSFAIPPTAKQQLGMIAAGANPSTVATMNHGGSCGITGLGEAGSVGCGGIRGFSVGAGLLVGGSFVTDVKWEACCENK